VEAHRRAQRPGRGGLHRALAGQGVRPPAEVEERVPGKNDELHDAELRAQFISGIIMPTMMFIGNLNYVAIAVVGGLRVAVGLDELGDVQAFIQYSRQFTQPLTQVASMANVLQSGVASAERVFELLDAPEEQTPSPRLTIDRPRGRVEFEDVSFSYEPDTPLIETCPRRRARPDGGDRRPDRRRQDDAGQPHHAVLRARRGSDHPRRGRHHRAARRPAVNIGMVLQDTWLFGGTIRENIAYGNPDATDAEILEAARATYVDRFVHSLPDGYDTVLDDEGRQRQRRREAAHHHRPGLPRRSGAPHPRRGDSSVDTRTEVLVQHAMAALRSDRTSFVIAHRLSTIRDAD
jgi:ATP-binding cassette subfamily B protein